MTTPIAALPEPAPAPPEPMTGIRKAAIFLLGVGDQVSAELLRQFAPDEIQLVTHEIASMNAVAPDQMLAVFREFEGRTADGGLFARGGAESARRLLEQALGADSAEHLLNPVPAPPASRADGLNVIEEADPHQLAMFLREEHPQTIALVLCNIPAEQAGALMHALPAELQPQIALRMATLGKISPEIYRRIVDAIGAKLKGVRQVSRSDGIQALARILNHVTPTSAESILSGVEAQNPDVATSVRDLMFVFDDVVKIDKAGIQALLARLDKKPLMMALKGTSQQIREHFTSCMSQRSAETFAEDMEALGPVRIRDVQQAQQEVIATIRLLQQDGTISLTGGAGDEYVV